MAFFQNLHFGLAGRGQNLTEGQQNKCYHCAEKKVGVGGGLRFILFFYFSPNPEKCMILTKKILHCADDTRKYEDDMHKDADNLSVSYNV